MSALLGVGGGAGVILAGPIADNLSYHYLFWLPLIPIVVATVATHFFVPESPVKVPGQINWTGALLMSLGTDRGPGRRERDRGVALALGEDDRPDRRGHRRCSSSGCGASRARQCRSSTCG